MISDLLSHRYSENVRDIEFLKAQQLQGASRPNSDSGMGAMILKILAVALTIFFSIVAALALPKAKALIAVLLLCGAGGTAFFTIDYLLSCLWSLFKQNQRAGGHPTPPPSSVPTTVRVDIVGTAAPDLRNRHVHFVTTPPPPPPRTPTYIHVHDPRTPSRPAPSAPPPVHLDVAFRSDENPFRSPQTEQKGQVPPEFKGPTYEYKGEMGYVDLGARAQRVDFSEPPSRARKPVQRTLFSYEASDASAPHLTKHIYTMSASSSTSASSTQKWGERKPGEAASHVAHPSESITIHLDPPPSHTLHPNNGPPVVHPWGGGRDRAG